ncbi:MAG: class I SAM-dependent methyltransferase [Candidatus Marinarcus sp.]|uniref:class I SAM-dependent methyltransferase n=1 Tax=Candidatus Marinarcus sp. TaxID=3100987 RepID=UPI003B0085C0
MEQKEFWNKKFETEEYFYGKKPNAFLMSCEKNFSKKERMLCLGEGEGRNAVHFAKKGFEVRALDASDVALAKLEAFAQEEGVFIKTTCLDLNDWVPKKKFGTIITSFLHLASPLREQVFNYIEGALKSKGFFVAEFFSKEQINYNSGGPKDLDLLYDVNSFEALFTQSKIHKLVQQEVILDEGKGHHGKASVIRIIVQKN